ncbi:uncharacterized protein LOC123899826 [Trifolium pratense]|uniref:uncharacterized protein LOC123899826 n=1 Tax=Trifolium pratense TaxID=57577 RepID=UPI001E6914E4|nr:uncharacterized protein LOC123899826 [Trifolium pratense]
MEVKDEDDPWLGADKLYHMIMCFSITLLFYFLSSLNSNPFLLRRHAISIASLISLLAGAAKEAADHLGFFRSSGASFRDAIADIIGVFIASFALYIFRSKTSRSPSHPQGISLV